MLPNVMYFPDGRSVCIQVYSGCPKLKCVLWRDGGYKTIEASDVAEAVKEYLHNKGVYGEAKSITIHMEYHVVKHNGVYYGIDLKKYNVEVEFEDGRKMEVKVYVSD